MSKHKTSFSKKLSPRYLQTTILKFLRKHPGKKYHAATLSRKLDVNNSKDSISKALETMALKDKLVTDHHGKFGYNPSYKGHHSGPATITHTGTVDMTASGGAYVVVNKNERDIYVPKKYLNGALHMDTVEISTRKSYGSRRPEGQVIKVVSRYKTSFLGEFRDFKKFGYVYVADRNINIEIKILPQDFNDAEDGNTVLVSITDFGRAGHHQYRGVIKHIFSLSSAHDYKMSSILINNGFNLFFPEEVMAESEKLVLNIGEEELQSREDFRNVWTCTIDPDDAKDFDDALSYRRKEDLIEIGVHIADVTHFVKEGTLLDKEALERSTSVYLVDRVCPMLPEKLSNDLCSLKPQVDRLTFAAIFEFKKDGTLSSTRFTKSIIHSDRRFTYNDVQEILDGQSSEYMEELNFLNKTAKQLRSERFENGSIDFDSDEVQFILDEDKKPIDIVRKERKDAHKLVEEFMLLANRKVAEWVSKKAQNQKFPFIYRVHDLPDPAKLKELAVLAGEFDIKLKLDTPGNIATSLNYMTARLANSDLLSILRPMAIRTMAKAEYAADNIGHFGLGFPFYTHFTSPIRRYSDVIAHRELDSCLKKIKPGPRDMDKMCKHISKKERSAIDAERASIKYKQVEYLQEHLGHEFGGMVRAIIDRGFFVELVDIQIDGMVSFERFNESFSLHPAKIKAIGNKTGREIRVGDMVRVKVLEADLERSQIDLELVEQTNIT